MRAAAAGGQADVWHVKSNCKAAGTLFCTHSPELIWRAEKSPFLSHRLRDCTRDRHRQGGEQNYMFDWGTLSSVKEKP